MRFRNNIIVMLVLLLLSCNNKKENIAYNKLRESNQLVDYELFLNQFPSSNRFLQVLKVYETKKNFAPRDSNQSLYLHSINNSRNSLDIFIVKDSIPCIRESLCSSHEFVEIYSGYFDYLWENNLPPARSSIIIDDNRKYYSAGNFRLFYNSTEASDTIQRMAILCKSILDKYKNNLAINWFNTAFNDLSPDKKKLLDSLLFNRIHFTKYEKNSLYYCNDSFKIQEIPEHLILNVEQFDSLFRTDTVKLN